MNLSCKLYNLPNCNCCHAYWKAVGSTVGAIVLNKATPNESVASCPLPASCWLGICIGCMILIIPCDSS